MSGSQFTPPPAPPEVRLRVNGIRPAFGIECGLSSSRADEGRAGQPYRQANVSYPLLPPSGGRIVRHATVDGTGG